jgi:hypothetical protein
VYPALLEALSQWARGGAKPTPQDIAARCSQLQATYVGECRMDPAFRPQPLATRVTARR